MATIARIPYVHRLEDVDFTWENMEIGLWSVIEVGIAIVATGLATLRPLLAKLGLLNDISAQSSGRKYSSRSHYRLNDRNRNDPKLESDTALHRAYHNQAEGGSESNLTGHKAVVTAYASAV